MLQKFLKKNLSFIILGITLLVIFYAFSFLVKEDVFTHFDFDMTVKVQAKVPVRLDPYLSGLSLLGSFEGTIVILLVFLLFKRTIGTILTIGLFCFMHVVEIIGKAFLDHPVTPFMFHRYAFDFIFPTGYVQPGGSYPSGHAMRTAFLAILFVFIVNRTKIPKNFKLASFLAILTIYFVMAVSRISLGEHWTSDVIGGTLLGSAFAFFSLMFI